MKNIYLTEEKYRVFIGENEITPNIKVQFLFGRWCILVSQTEYARWWTSEKIYAKVNGRR